MIKKLLFLMNSLPGITTICNSVTDELKINIWFKSTDSRGLFILTRCTDRRYWEFGHLWRIELVVGDQFEKGYLPTHYLLTYVFSDDNIYSVDTQIDSLIRNIEQHLFDMTPFLTIYNLEGIDIEVKSKMRRNKLKKIVK